MKYDKIVVGVDGSDHAQRALATAADLAATYNGSVHVVIAVRYPSASQIASELKELPEEFKASYDALAYERDTLMAAEQFLADRGVPCTSEIVDNRPAAAILDEADRVDADLVIVGSRGMSPGTRFMRGSVSGRITNYSRRNFMVVH